MLGERIILSPRSQIQLSKQKYENLPEVVERKKKEKKEKDLAEFRMNAKLIAEKHRLELLNRVGQFPEWTPKEQWNDRMIIEEEGKFKKK
ncbi:MAG: hypothetical protein EZS28_033890 [Streblomastix strix]|uniref:ALMS motif domain-containing protein n=1 Tax=Streblomastix strix TaxID=222440 RepID=A0A5J4ULI9_9EUKA|nr:MAG: hypothetical protein EZS28_033890 [Streblomastix strix]